MTAPQAPAPAAPPAPPAAPADSAAPDTWGHLLDAAGVIAGILLVAIVIDVWTDGRLISRRLHGKPQQGEAPVE